MGLYFSLINKNKEVIINRVKVIFIGNIWENILKQNGVLNEDECMICDDEYVIKSNEFPKIIEYYENLIDGFSDDEYCGSVGVVRHKLLKPLKEQLEFGINGEEYIIKVD